MEGRGVRTNVISSKVGKKEENKKKWESELEFRWGKGRFKTNSYTHEGPAKDENN